MKELLWGIDLGGTKVEGVVLRRDGEVLVRHRIPTEREKGYQHILDRIGYLVQILVEQSGQRPGCIGIGTPGTIDPATGLMKNSNTTVMNGRPFRDDLSQQLGIPLEMANDANCLAVAETRLGAASHLMGREHVVFGVIMGTGVGGGLVINGRARYGIQGIGGEWGHNFLDESGGLCYCGNTGCVETVISGTALERYYEAISGRKQALATIIKRYEQGQADEQEQATVRRLIHFFGKSLASVINLLDPDAVVLGGGLSNVDLLYSEGLKEVEKHVFNTSLKTPILRPQLGDSAGVFGAALLVA